MLKQGRYTWRHDSVLSFLANVCKGSGDNMPKVYVDLTDHPWQTVTTIPQEILPSSQRPDLVMFWPNLKKIFLVELTVPFEPNIVSAHLRKVNKYASLVSDLQDKGLTVDFLALEVGSRGYISPENLKALKQLTKMSHVNVSFKSIRDQLSKIALCTSFSIFCSKSEPTWQEPDIFKL